MIFCKFYQKLVIFFILFVSFQVSQSIESLFHKYLKLILTINYILQLISSQAVIGVIRSSNNEIRNQQILSSNGKKISNSSKIIIGKISENSKDKNKNIIKKEKDLNHVYGNDIIDPYLSEDELQSYTNNFSLIKEMKPKLIIYPKFQELKTNSKILFRFFPKLDFRMDPIINFKLKQGITLLGTSVTLGIDFLSDIMQWRTFCSVEDTLVGGRFSLRGSELGWTKSWLWNLGLVEDNTAKFKLRLGLNFDSLKLYARLRFRTEPISPFDIGEGISCAGKVSI